MSSEIEVRVNTGVATLLLNRPEKRNAITFKMWQELGDVLVDLADQTSVRVLVVRGAGQHFCAGADISGLSGGIGGGYGEANWRAEEALVNFPVPTIAYIQGNCVGGGVSIATACDIRICDTTAEFGITPAKLGIVYPTNALTRVVQLIGPSKTKRLMFTAELIDAVAAERIGLVDEVHDLATLGTRIDELVVQVLEQSQLTQVATKQMIAEIMVHGSVLESTAAAWEEEINASGELTQGLEAFSARRVPIFPWRRPISASTLEP
ncbi:MAG: enoyl-CoA hydratase/isomerase family protein [Ilumatobacteraceae bacterium]|nr:enoyl-CoA hydratase/isomerase family protein [Ilumatobacteraceae bacterium]